MDYGTWSLNLVLIFQEIGYGSLCRRKLVVPSEYTLGNAVVEVMTQLLLHTRFHSNMCIRWRPEQLTDLWEHELAGIMQGLWLIYDLQTNVEVQLNVIK